MTHTPGPWIACGWKNVIVNAPNGATLALYPSDDRHCPLERVQANAKLIAESPTMLRLLRQVMDECDKYEQITGNTWDDIAKVLSRLEKV